MSGIVDVLIRDCLIATINSGVIDHGFIAINDDRILDFGRIENCRYHGETIIEAKGMVAMPGLINLHTHSPMTLLRGVAEDLPLDRWLREVIWPIEANLKPEDVYWGAKLACIEMLKSGVTCFNDMYFYMDMVAKAVEETGIRAVLSHGIIGVGKPDGGLKDLEEGLKFALENRGRGNGRVLTALGPHAEYTVQPELLARIAEYSGKYGLPVHFHYAESKELLEDTWRRTGENPLKKYDEINLLNDRLTLVHCIYLELEDIDLLAKRKVSIAYNPVSNAKLAQGIARVREMIRHGINVGIGTDGPASNNTLDLLRDLRFASIIQKAKYLDPTALSSLEILKMATINGAKALGINNDIGDIEKGKKADIILLDLKSPYLHPVHNIYSTIVYSACGLNVDTVIVDGKVLVKNGKCIHLDEEEIMKKADEKALDLIKRSM
ncbi:MAG: amidohydrolase [Candidatus Methanomethylicia archaeon]